MEQGNKETSRLYHASSGLPAESAFELFTPTGWHNKVIPRQAVPMQVIPLQVRIQLVKSRGSNYPTDGLSDTRLEAQKQP